MSSCHYKNSLPIKKKILMNTSYTDAQKCPVNISTLLPDGEPPDMCSQSSQVSADDIEQRFGDKACSEPSLFNIDDSESNKDILDSEVEAEIDETLENEDYSLVQIQPGLTADLSDDSDCVIVEQIVPTIDISDEVDDEENQKKKRQVNQGFDELKHQFCKRKNETREGLVREIEKSHRDLTCNSDSEVRALLDNSDSEQIGSEKDVGFEKFPVSTEDQNNNQSLPDGWVRFRHDSGLYAYYHVETKVCTMAPPYALGPDSVRHHKIPVQAIPCLHEQQRTETADGVESVMPKQVHMYCQNLFRFKTRRSIYYKNWKNKRWYDSLNKRFQVAKNPSTSIVKLPVKNKCGGDILLPFNISNKSYLMLLFEYVNLGFKKQVEYRVEPISSQGPHFLATVFIEGTWYGSGIGPTKKLAKNQAARLLLAAMLGIVPELNNLTYADKLRDIGEQNVLDNVAIDDPRVLVFCKMKNEVLPFAMLETALGRNENLKELDLQHKIVKQGGGFEYVMEMGRYSATVKCRNKVDGKHRAAQELLKQIHPIVKSWGGIVRLYRESFIDERVHRLEVAEEKREVNQGLLNELKFQFSKLEQDRREQSEKGIKKSHYDILWEPKLLQYNPSYELNDAKDQTELNVQLELN